MVKNEDKKCYNHLKYIDLRARIFHVFYVGIITKLKKII
jgi:hypothetical protein